ncbi:MAG: VRR-NUC domain-containing protein [Gammaproteobacteria bacterium]
MKHLEDQHQHALFTWARTYRVQGEGVAEAATLAHYMIAIPNGGQRYPLEAQRLIGLGVKSGVSDIFLALPRNGYHGLWIEMKKPKKDFPSPSAARAAFTDHQRSWQRRMALANYACAVCYGWDQAQAFIVGYLLNSSDVVPNHAQTQ